MLRERTIDFDRKSHLESGSPATPAGFECPSILSSLGSPAREASGPPGGEMCGQQRGLSSSFWLGS
jgi:hypothetical protein